MRDCWIEKPDARPSFTDLVEDIGRILSIASGKVSLTNFQYSLMIKCANNQHRVACHTYKYM